MRFNANMPMLSRQGFIDLCSIEYLLDPSQAHIHLARAVSHYGVWSLLGPMPRDVLPEGPTEESAPSKSPKKAKQKKEKTKKDVVDEEIKVKEITEAQPTKNPIRVRGGEKKAQALLNEEEFTNVELDGSEIRHTEPAINEASTAKEATGDSKGPRAATVVDEKDEEKEDSNGESADLYKAD